MEEGKRGYKISFIVIVAQLCDYIKIIEWYTLDGELHGIWIILLNKVILYIYMHTHWYIFALYIRVYTYTK